MLSISDYIELLIHYDLKHSSLDVDSYDDKLKVLQERYSFEYLAKIVNDTYDIIDFISNNINDSYGGYYFPMNDYDIKHIDVGVNTSYYSDDLFIMRNGNIISKKILKYTFGNLVDISIDKREYPINDNSIKFYALHIDNVPLEYSYLEERKLIKK